MRSSVAAARLQSWLELQAELVSELSQVSYESTWVISLLLQLRLSESNSLSQFKLEQKYINILYLGWWPAIK